MVKWDRYTHVPMRFQIGVRRWRGVCRYRSNVDSGFFRSRREQTESAISKLATRKEILTTLQYLVGQERDQASVANNLNNDYPIEAFQIDRIAI